jgi:hypothetical protein
LLDLFRREPLRSIVIDERIAKLEAKHAWQEAQTGATVAVSRRGLAEFSLLSHRAEAIDRCG